MTTARATRAPAHETAERTFRRQPRPDLRVVPDAAPRRRRRAGLIATLSVLAVFAALFGLAVFHTFLVESQATLDDLELEILAGSEATEDLRLELAELQSPDRIIAMAVDDLGMLVPTEVVMLTPPEIGPGPAPLLVSTGDGAEDLAASATPGPTP